MSDMSLEALCMVLASRTRRSLTEPWTNENTCGDCQWFPATAS